MVVVGRQGRQLSLSFHNFDSPMGMAATGDALAVASKSEVWLHRNARKIAGQVQPAGNVRCVLPGPNVPSHRRNTIARGCLDRRRAVGREHPVFVSLYASAKLQLRTTLAATIRLESCASGPLPPEWALRRTMKVLGT